MALDHVVIVGQQDRIQAIVNWIKGANNKDEATEDGLENRDWVNDVYSKDEVKMNYKGLSLNRTGIFGIPYQFNSYADVPYGKLYSDSDGSTQIGRVYEEHIFANMPITYFEIGKPLFMDKLVGDKSTGSWVLQALIDSAGSGFNLGGGVDLLSTPGTIEDVSKRWLSHSANQLRYYSFVDDFNNYAKYVNSMCRFLALKMGIGDKECVMMNDGQHYVDFDIRRIKNRFMSTTLLTTMADTATSYHVPLYCNASSTNVSESGNNSTGDSMLASALKTGSQLTKELGFILNSTAPDLSNEAVKKATDILEGITGNLTPGGISGFLKKLGNLGANVVSGSNMMFPSVWQDSMFTKSYTISCRLTTPYGDPESIFNDIYVPLICILAFSLPRQTTSSGYSAPFLIKAHSKGYFNCDMGMVDSIDIKRGGPNNTDRSYDSLPTDIEVTFTIKDLYPAIVMTQAKASAFMFSSNTGLVDYLNMMAGLNLTTLDPLSNIEAGIAMLMSNVWNWQTSLGSSVNHFIYKNMKYVTETFLS